MPDHLQITENIRTFLAGDDQTRSPVLGDWAALYADMCRQANERLRRCVDYLRRGLRAEAIHLSEEPPALVELSAVLDLPEAGPWETICLMYELPRAPRIYSAAAQALAEASAAAEPIKALLAQHRRLAVACAPLAHRIALLRQLAAADPNNPCWHEDLGELERARLREIQSDALAASRIGDRQTLVELADELGAGGWRVEPPPDLRAGLARAARRYRQQEALDQLRAMLPDLQAAWQAGDYEACVAHLGRWQSLIDGSRLAMPADLHDQLQPIADWVAQTRAARASQRDFDRACQALTHALNADVATSELDRLKAKVSSYQLDAPADLLGRYRRTVDSRKRTARRRRTVRWTLALTVLCACGIGAWLIVDAQLQRKKASDAYDELSRLIAGEQIDQARKFWERLTVESPQVASRPEMKDRKAALDKLVAQEEARAAEFRAQLAAAVAAGVDNPNTAALKSARDKARTQPEKRELADFEAKVEAAQRIAQQKLEEAWKASVENLARQVATAGEDLRAGKVDAAQSALNRADAALEDLGKTPTIGADLRRSLEPIRQEIRSLRERIVRDAKEKSAMDNVVGRCSSAASLKTALEEYARESPDSPRARPFRQAAADAPAWEAAEQWLGLVSRWGGVLTPVPTDVSARLELVNEYLRKFGSSPLATIASDYRDHLAVSQKTLAPDGPWKADLAAVLRSPLLAGLKCIRANDGRLYYLADNADWRVGPAVASFNAVTSNDVSRTRAVTLKTGEYQGEPAPAPQSLLSRELLGRIENLSGDGWETFALDLIDALRQRNEVDPVLRVLLLSRIVRYAQSAAWPAPESLKALVEGLRTVDAEDVAWMDADDAGAAAARRRATEAIAKMPDAKDLRAAAASRRDALARAIRPRLLARGVALRDVVGGWEVHPPVPAREGIVVMAVAGERRARSLVQVGQFADGKIEMDRVAMRDLPEGTMVFVCLTAP